MIRADVAAMLDAEGNPNIVKSFLSMPADLLEAMVDAGESVDSIFTTSYMLESGLLTAERLRLRLQDRKEGPMAKDKVSDVDLESCLRNPLIPASDAEIIDEARLQEVKEKWQEKLGPAREPEVVEDLEDPANNEFIPEGV